MENKFFKGFQRTQQLNPARSREAEVERTGAMTRAERLNRALDKASLGADKALDQVAAKESREEVELAVAQAGEDYLGGGTPEDGKGSLRKLAYETIAAKSAVSGLGEYTRQYVEGNVEDLADVSDEDIKRLSSEARDKYFEEKKLNDKSYLGEIKAYSNEYSPAILGNLMKKRNKLKQAKAISSVRTEVLSTFESSGSIEDFEREYEANRATYMLTTGDGVRTDETAFGSLVEAAMKGNKEAADYIKSEKARNKFGNIEGFDKTLSIADKRIKENDKARLKEIQSIQREKIYGDALVGVWDNEKEIRDSIMSTQLPNKEKLSLINKFVKTLETDNEAINLLKKFKGDKANGIIPKRGGLLSAKKEVLEAAFKEETSYDVTDISLDIIGSGQYPDEAKKQIFQLKGWVDAGLPVPKPIIAEFNDINNNGSLASLNNIANAYSTMAQQSPNILGQIFKDTTASKIEAYNIIKSDVRHIKADGTPDRASIANALDDFDRTAKANLEGITQRNRFERELDFKANGGISDSIREDLREVGEDDAYFQFTPAVSADYSERRMSTMYILNRSAGLDEDKAYERAKSLYKSTHTTVELASGNYVDLPTEALVDPDNMAGVVEYLVIKKGAHKEASRLLGKNILPENVNLVPAVDYDKTKALELREKSSGIRLGRVTLENLRNAKDSFDKEGLIKGSIKGELKKQEYQRLLHRQRQAERWRGEYLERLNLK